jgi:transcriptional regulator with XRE-family HTH domain
VPKKAEYAKTRIDRAKEIEGICARLKECREQQRLTQPEVAQMLGISWGRYAKWEQRTAPPTAYLAQLCLILRVPPWWLLTGQRRPPEVLLDWFRRNGYRIDRSGGGEDTGRGGGTESNNSGTQMRA